MSDDDQVTVGELNRSFIALREELVRFQTMCLLRTEFEAWRGGIVAQIADIKAQQASRTVPWPVVLTALVSVAALACTLIPLIANG